MKIMSFGYSCGGEPKFENMVVFDCRKLPDPGSIKGLSDKDGTHPNVQKYVGDTAGYQALIPHVDEAIAAGKDLAFGDGGGRFRGVAVASLVKAKLEAGGVADIELDHRDLDPKTHEDHVSTSDSDDMTEDDEGSDEDEGSEYDPAEDLEKAKDAFWGQRNKKRAADYLEAAKTMYDEEGDDDALACAANDIVDFLRGQ